MQLAYGMVVALSACVADAAAGETVVQFMASREYAGGIVTLGAEARTLDAGGHAEWTVVPAIVDQAVFITLELDGVRETFVYDSGFFRSSGYIPEDAALDRLVVYLHRSVDSGECNAYVSSVSAGGHNVVADARGLDSERCGPFAR